MRQIKDLLLFVLFTVLFLSGCNKQSQTKKPVVQKELTIAEKIADVYGASSFGKINSIKFTFNVQKGDKQVYRSWYWEPKTNLVMFLSYSGSKPFTYLRKQLSENPTEELKSIDAKFINDQYWLLFPLHLVLDKNVNVSLDKGLFKLPIGEGKTRRVIVEYTGGNGYTPNDKYELYIDKNYKIIQWIYRRNNSPTPTRLTKWEDYKKVGPLYLSLSRPGKDESFRVWFTDVEVK
ncbi:hypothetical protein BMS3Abin04_01490 [bacterium BMS3Abin04]|nr:hypothetical protein BMS3Abin04_01490 [bacterium BMS3Abin04]